MDDKAAPNAGDPGWSNNLLNEGSFPDSKSMPEIGSVIEELRNIELDLACCSEKLLNLEALLLHTFAWEADFNELGSEGDNISVESIEKALAVDLLAGILDSETTVLNNFMVVLEAQIIDAHQKSSSCMHLTDLSSIVEGKLHDSEESLKQSQENVLEMKMQLAKLQMGSLTFNHNHWKKPRGHNMERRHILRMLEKSLARELELEKKLTEFKQHEEDLKSKLRLTEQVALFMEEAAEVVWGRFLEAENVASILMGISKDMVSRVQLLQFNLNSSLQKEEELKAGLNLSTEQLKDKENAIDQLRNSIAQIICDCSEVSVLRENVKLLEEELVVSESQLKKVKSYGEACEGHLSEMDSVIESLKEDIYAAETRAENAEAKVTQLTETNLELTEELNFLKSSNDSNTKKVSVLEKQIRELELQLQHSRASSEVSQEQQNMLYTAIWDMETLIDELKQNLSKAENKTQTTEEQCLLLSKANLDLSKELDFLRARMGSLETSLNETNNEKIESAKDISMKSNIILEMVSQLSLERERLKKQLYSLAEENRLLMYHPRNAKENAPARTNGNADVCDKDFTMSGHNSSNSTQKETYSEVGTESSPKSWQTEELPKVGTEANSSIPADDGNAFEGKAEVQNVTEGGMRVRRYTVIIVLVLSMLIPYTLRKKFAVLDAFYGL